MLGNCVMLLCTSALNEVKTVYPSTPTESRTYHFNFIDITAARSSKS